MKLQFKVHSSAYTETSAVVEVNGKEITVAVPCWEVVLTDVDNNHGTVVLRFVGKDFDTAKAKFKNGEKVTVSLD